jgi:hypothetical protein
MTLATQSKTPVRVDQRGPACWRVTLDNPSINLFDPEMLEGLQSVIERLAPHRSKGTSTLEVAVLLDAGKLRRNCRTCRTLSGRNRLVTLCSICWR